MSWFRKPKQVALILSFLLPLVYTTGNWAVFKANIDAWFLWGIVYVGLAFIAGKLADRFSTRNR